MCQTLVAMQINDELCHMMGVQCNITSAYHPQSNSFHERFNQTLQQQLLKYVNDEQNDWDLHLDASLFSYRVSRQDSTKTSPFLPVYGRQPKLPVEFSLDFTEEEKDAATSVVESEITESSEHEASPPNNLVDEEDASAEKQRSSHSGTSMMKVFKITSESLLQSEKRGTRTTEEAV